MTSSKVGTELEEWRERLTYIMYKILEAPDPNTEIWTNGKGTWKDKGHSVRKHEINGNEGELAMM